VCHARGVKPVRKLDGENDFLVSALVPNWVLDLNLVRYRAIVQLDDQRISDRASFRVVVLDTEALVLDAVNLARSVSTRGSAADLSLLRSGQQSLL
jgi:hypothetical protein